MIKKEYSDRIEWLNEKGELHREDGPAIEWNNGDKSWWINEQRHRDDGPAIEWGVDKYWFLNGIEYSEQEYKKELLKIRLKRIENL